MNGASPHDKHESRQPQGSTNRTYLSDSELVRLCLEKNRPAWEEFFRRYIPLIKKTIKRKLWKHGYGYVTDDQDILCDIHAKIVENLYGRGMLRKCVNAEGLRFWLITVASNQTTAWVIEQGRDKRLPQKQTEDALRSLSEPIRGAADLTIGDSIAADDQQEEDLLDYAENVLEIISKDGTDKNFWALRLSLIADLPLTATDIAKLAELCDAEESEIRSRIAEMMQQVEVKEDRRKAAQGRAILCWHELRRLEARLIEGNASSLSATEIKEIELEIQKKTAQREKLLQMGRSLSLPEQKHIAALIGLPPEKAGQISELLIRARKSLQKILQQTTEKQALRL